MKSSNITKYRSIWMGVAILWVMYSHQTFEAKLHFFQAFHDMGYIGVDMFLFASGFGIFHSLHKDQNFGRYFERRLIRLLPAYYIFLVFWVLIKKFTVGLTNSAIIGNILFVQFFTGKGESFNWYISLLWLCYFMAPFFYLLIRRFQGAFGKIIMLAVVIAGTIPFWYTEDMIMAIARIPVFFIGMVIANMLTEKEYLPIWQILLSLIAGVAALLFWNNYYYDDFWTAWNLGLHWYPFIILAPVICLVISILANLLEDWTRALRHGRSDYPGYASNLNFLLVKVGEYSFEIFLWHVTFTELYRDYLIPVKGVEDCARYWFYSHLASFGLAIVLHYLAKPLAGFLKK